MMLEKRRQEKPVKKLISIVVPMYNEESTLGILYEELNKVINSNLNTIVIASGTSTPIKNVNDIKNYLLKNKIPSDKVKLSDYIK